MTLVLDLPPELETQLVAEAARLHIPLSAYAIQLLGEGRMLDAKPRNGSELLAYWQTEGLVGTRADISDPMAHARTLRLQAEKRERSHP